MDADGPGLHAAPASAWVIFCLGSQVYGLPVASIEQIVPMVTITPLPEIDEPVTGAITVRGKPVPVVDLRCHVGRAEATFFLDTPILLAHIAGHALALVADEVLDVVSLAPADLIAPAQILPFELGEAPVITALAHLSGGLGLLLDPDHLFRPEQREILARATEMLSQLAVQAVPPGGDPGAGE